MSCRKFRDPLVALARGAGEPQDRERIRAHFETCPSCRRTFDDQQALTAGLRELAASSRDAQPTDALEDRLLARFDEERARTPAPAAAWLRWWPAAAAAALAIAAATWWQLAGTPRATAPLPAAPRPVVIELAGFQPLPQSATLPDFDSGEIVRTEVALNALPVYGVRIPPDAAAATVTVDFLVAQDGQPRMIRLVTEDEQDTRSR